MRWRFRYRGTSSDHGTGGSPRSDYGSRNDGGSRSNHCSGSGNNGCTGGHHRSSPGSNGTPCGHRRARDAGGANSDPGPNTNTNGYNSPSGVSGQGWRPTNPRARQ